MSLRPSQTRDRAFAPQPPPRIGLARSRPTTARAQPFGVAGSFALHAGIVAASLLAWQHALDLPKETTPIPVDLITIAPKTNVAPMAPDIKMTARNDFAPVEITPPPPLPEQAEPAPVKPVMPKPKSAPPKKTIQQDFSALLNKLTKPAPPPKNARRGAQRIAGIGAQTAMTADLADALRSQIYKCWSPNVTAPNPNDVVVDFDVFLNEDGSVAKAQSDALSSRNSYTLAAAGAAQRAIMTCQPYKLPADRYSEWREVNPLHFDPRQMMGQ